MLFVRSLWLFCSWRLLSKFPLILSIQQRTTAATVLAEQEERVSAREREKMVKESIELSHNAEQNVFCVRVTSFRHCTAAAVMVVAATEHVLHVLH